MSYPQKFYFKVLLENYYSVPRTVLDEVLDDTSPLSTTKVKKKTLVLLFYLLQTLCVVLFFGRF